LLASYGPGLGDPPGSSVIVAAMSWLEATLLGTVTTTLAIVAVAAVGFMMLAGRINFRRSATVILGCFILFGARAIAAGIQSFVGGGGLASYEPPPPEPPVPVLPPLPEPPTNSDPYAGASVPSR
jgi:type IV secretory pathway VirB2 component (pilin)